MEKDAAIIVTNISLWQRLSLSFAEISIGALFCLPGFGFWNWTSTPLPPSLICIIYSSSSGRRVGSDPTRGELSLGVWNSPMGFRLPLSNFETSPTQWAERVIWICRWGSKSKRFWKSIKNVKLDLSIIKEIDFIQIETRIHNTLSKDLAIFVQTTWNFKIPLSNFFKKFLPLGSLANIRLSSLIFIPFLRSSRTH